MPAKWRAELGISEWSDDQAKGKMAIQFDNGEKWLVEQRGSGWTLVQHTRLDEMMSFLMNVQQVLEEPWLQTNDDCPTFMLR